MRERSLLILSFFLAGGGLTALLVIAFTADIGVVPVSSLTPELVGQGVKACGTVEGKFTSRAGHVFFRLDDGTGEIRIVVFNSTRARVEVDEVCVVGTVDVYEGELEIIARSVTAGA